MFKLEPKTFDFTTIKGISLKQLSEHYKLYNGYVAKLNEIWNMPTDASIYGESNPTYSKMRSLKLGETFTLNGVNLHQLYFNNICGDSKFPYGDILNLINRDFNSFDNFLDYLKSVALSMRGWAILTISPIDNKLHIIGCDAHDTGAIWSYIPLLVLDVYEHAYFLDFATDRKKYIDVFIENINWKVVNERLQKYFYMKSSLEGIRYTDNRLMYANCCPYIYLQ